MCKGLIAGHAGGTGQLLGVTYTVPYGNRLDL